MQPVYLFDLASRHAEWASVREAVVTGNIANANTAGYQAVDIEPFSAILNATGGTILLFVLLALSVILSTQFSLGRAVSGAARLVRLRAAALGVQWTEWSEARRREKERKQIVTKHLKKAGKTAPEIAGKAQDAAAALKKALKDL